MFNVNAPETKGYKRKLKVIIWKCYKMRINNSSNTLLEFSIPILFFFLLFILRNTGTIVEISVDDDIKYEPQNIHVPPIFDITYAPNTSDVNDFMNSVQSSISGSKVELDGYQTEDDVRRFIDRKVNNNTENKKMIGVLFNNYNKDSTVLNYRILAECYRSGMDLAFQTDPPYVTLWAEDYNTSGFLVLQKAIDFTFIEKKGKGKNVNIRFEKMPAPPHKLENQMLNRIINFIIPFSLLLLFCSLMPMMISEKTFGTKQIMIVMGLEPWQYWLGWFLYASMTYIFNVAITTTLFTVNFFDNMPTPFNHSNGFIIWFFILCFYVSTVCFIFLFSAIFSEVHISEFIMLLWLFPVLLIPNMFSPENIPVAVMVLCMFMPTCAYGFGMETLLGYERIGGVHFSNMFTKPNIYSKSPSFGLIIFMLILDSFIYFGLAWYVAYVWPGQFGVPKPWNFLFQKSFWFPPQEEDSPQEVQLAPLEKKPEIEPVSGLSASIKIRDLVKTYGYKNAVDGLNIDLYSKQITVLLGHNGAGKTTAISMITGMIYPTHGIITINGYDVHKNYNAVRQQLGLCLQHNLEISGLTVMDHLIFFGLLRGCNIADTKQEALDFLKMANMENKENSQVSDLSGGMKRKVSIGMATIGKSKVVLLDEPTSGLDPQARRDLWDFLLAMRGERSILITTHYMEEAEILGDRIAMHSGRLVCYGTTLFLKKLYSTGYKLTVIVKNPESNDINSLIKSHVSGANFKSSKGGCLVFSLPTNDNTVLYGLVKALDGQKDKLSILNYGIKNASLEEVFIKVGEIADANKGAALKINQNKLKSDVELTEEYSTSWCLSLKALIFKRLYYYNNNKYKMIMNLIVTFLILVFYFLLFLFLSKLPSDKAEIQLTLEMYYESESFYSCDSASENLGKSYKNIVNAQGGKATLTLDIYESILEIANSDESQYHRTLITGAQFNGDFKAMYGHYAIHGPPISLNLMANSILQSNTNNNEYSIKVAYTPLLHLFSTQASYIKAFFALFIFIIGFGNIILDILFTIYDEVSTGFKHLQQMTGVPRTFYWITTFIIDYFLYLIYVLMYFIMLTIFDSNGPVGSSASVIAQVFYYIIIFGLSNWPFFYCFTLSSCFHAKSPSQGRHILEQLIVIIVYLFGLISPIAVLVCTYRDVKIDILNIFFLLLNVIPLHAIMVALLKISMTSLTRHQISQSKNVLAAVGHPCADWNSNGCDDIISFYKGKYSVQDQETFLYWDILIYWVLLFLFETGLFSYILQLILGIITCKIFQPCCAVFNENMDDDVINERDRVRKQIYNRNERTDIFLVSNLYKWYHLFSAVRGINFGVKSGECFGLLGVNGAGKTTTFRMLTGEIIQNFGNVYFENMSLNLNRFNFFKKIGYCPQFDGFIQSLTIREMLYVYGSMRGIPSNKINNHIEKWLSIFDIEIYGNVKCGNLSGGTKRKVSSALCLIGNPILIMLDEPTSGIDPHARRNLWEILGVLQKSGRSIILSSQSMDECEALCDRLAIMVKGQFECIGNIQHLRNKFSYGCSINIKLSVSATYEYRNIHKQLKDAISSGIDCTLTNEFYGLLEYKITNRDIRISSVFAFMENMKYKFNIIEDFSISSSSLEEIFLVFAKKK